MSDASMWLKLLGAGLGFVGISAVLVKLALFLHSKEAESKLARVMAVLVDASKAAALQVETTLKPQLVAALSDGVLTDTERAQLKAAAMSLVTSQLPGAVIEAAKGFYGALFPSVLSATVEGAVASMRASGIAAQVAPSGISPGEAAKVLDPKPTPDLRKGNLPFKSP